MVETIKMLFGGLTQVNLSPAPYEALMRPFHLMILAIYKLFICLLHFLTFLF